MHAASQVHPRDLHPLASTFSRLNVAPRKFAVMQDGVPKVLQVSKMAVAPSLVRALARQRHSLGLYSLGNKKDDILAVFLAPIETAEFSDELHLAGYGQHLLHVPLGGYTMNGAYDSPDTPLPHTDAVRWTLTDYVERSAVGNLINDCCNVYGETKQLRAGEPNCRMICIETIGEKLPCVQTGALRTVSHLMFFCATRDLEWGEEALYCMDKAHRDRYIRTMLFDRRMHLVDKYPVRAALPPPVPLFAAAPLPPAQLPAVVPWDSFLQEP